MNRQVQPSMGLSPGRRAGALRGSLGWTLISLGLLGLTGRAWAVAPDNVFLLVNKNVPESREIALHYCQKRGVPHDHIITLDLPADDDISRQDYDTRLAAPLRKALKERSGKARVLLSIYGVPLRVGPMAPSVAEKAAIAIVKTQLERTRDDATRREKEERLRQLSHAQSVAAVDSELSLLWWDDYELDRWQLNLLYFQVPPVARLNRQPILLVARLDGPSPAVAYRLVDQAMEVEQKGLQGKVYVDARGFSFNASKENGTGYGGYDESLREMARLLGGEGKLSVTLDNEPSLFTPGSCADCALYCGWYSLANYVDCCRFVPGAVAYHIASAEAISLRDPRRRYWCKELLEHGAAATLGPVAEPYTIGFPKPAEFFGLLVTGKYTLVECYASTMPLTSWMTVLIGDPLYNPYARNPRLSPDLVKPSPRSAQPLIQRKP